MRRWALGVASLSLAFVLSSCDSNESAPPPTDSASPAHVHVDRALLRQLTDRAVSAMPPSANNLNVTAVDFAAARSRMGLPVDADPRAFEKDLPGPEQIAEWEFYGSQEALGRLADDPALDVGLVDIAVTVSGPAEVTVLQTRQDVSELVAIPGIATGNDLVVVTSTQDSANGSKRLASTALADTIKPSSYGADVATLANAGPGVHTLSVENASVWTCLDAIATVSSFSNEGDNDGVVVLKPRGTPDDVLPVLKPGFSGTWWSGWRFSNTELRGGWWWADVQVSQPAVGGAPLTMITMETSGRPENSPHFVSCVDGAGT